MNAITTKLNLIDLKHLNKNESRIFMALLGMNKQVNENSLVYISVGSFIERSLELAKGDGAKTITVNKILCILYSYFKSENQKYKLRLICKKNKRNDWFICGATEEQTINFYTDMEEENSERLEKSAKAKAKAKNERDAEKTRLNDICNSKNVTMEVAKSMLAKEKETNKKNEELKKFSDADLLCELLNRGIIDNADFESIKARMSENKEIA